MTPEERAQKILYQFSGRDFQTLDESRLRELLIKQIAAQIAEDRRDHPCFGDGVKEGFAAAKAKAKGLFFPGDYIAEKYAIELIEKIKP